MIRVVLVDDHALFRAGLRALLHAEPDLVVVGEAADGEAGVAIAASLRPDVLLMDLQMPGIDGIEATARVLRLPRPPAVLVLTAASESDSVADAVEAGAVGVFAKRRTPTELLAAIRTVARGEAYLSPSAAARLVQHHRAGTASSSYADPLDRLSERERAVALRVARGFTAVQIGDELHISPKTVDTYRSRAMAKLGVRRRSELVQAALRAGLLARVA